MRRLVIATVVVLTACTAAGSSGSTADDVTTAPATLETTTSASQVSPTTTMEEPSSEDVECPSIDRNRQATSPGPLYLCEIRTDGELMFGGQIVARPGVSSAEDAVSAWLGGPTEEEQSEGLQGWDLRPYAWFADSLSFRREGTTLVMELEEWEPINNLSTSNGSIVFYLTLFGTVFSDPTVDQFELVILGESCPVMIGESEWCFPIDWEDYIRALG
jgi:hypothetical protein